MQNAMRRVVVTGLGAVTPLGVVNIKERNPKFATLPSQVAGIEHETRMTEKWRCLRNMLWLQRKKPYKTQIGDPSQRKIFKQPGVYIGSGIGSLDDAYNTAVEFEKGFGYKKVSPLFVPRLLINLAAGHISMRYGFKGPNHAATTACTTGVHAIGDAARMIMFGDADVMVAGGAESCIHPLAIAGFARARSLATDWNDSPEKASRPFDRSRAGFVIGEGAGVVVLELEHAKARGAPIYAEIKGYGLSSDAHHMTAPREDGQGPYLAMKRALKQAGIKPANVDYVNAHATSTVLGDAAENRAIKTILLGEEGHTSAQDVNISSTKGAVGHLLGAAGAAETIFTVLALQNQAGDPASDFDCNYVPNTAQDHNVQVALSNSFGFGGTNASICLSRYG
ncbi:unnamed protein product [Aureobasidium pullulans]|nr:unnamed protein product [Aureobasidium pullulans]